MRGVLYYSVAWEIDGGVCIGEYRAEYAYSISRSEYDSIIKCCEIIFSCICGGNSNAPQVVFSSLLVFPKLDASKRMICACKQKTWVLALASWWAHLLWKPSNVDLKFGWPHMLTYWHAAVKDSILNISSARQMKIWGRYTTYRSR